MAAIVIIGLAIPTKILGDKSDALVIQKTPLDVLTDTSSKEEIIEAIRYVSKKYLVDESQLMQTIKCESGYQHAGVFGDWSKTQDKYLAYGLGQFHLSTWDMMNKERGTELSYYSVRDQLDMMAWAFSKGYQKHWSCFKKYFGS